jgi:hypothetical protein
MTCLGQPIGAPAEWRLPPAGSHAAARAVSPCPIHASTDLVTVTQIVRVTISVTVTLIALCPNIFRVLSRRLMSG